MARRGLIGLALALLFAPVAVAGPHAHGASQFEFVSRTVSVGAGQSAVLESVACPKGFKVFMPRWNVTSGEGGALPQGQTDKGVVYRLDNAFASTSSTVDIGVLCIKETTKRASQVDGEAHRHQIRQDIESKPLQLPGRGAFTSANVTCPTGFSAVNGFLDGDRRAAVESSMPSGDGKSWNFGISNLTNDAETTATANVQCIGDQTGPPVQRKKKNCNKIKNAARRRKCRKEQRKLKRHAHAVERAVVEKKVDVPSSPEPQEQAITVAGEGTCPRGMFPAGVGWSFLGHPFTLLNGFASDALDEIFRFVILNRSTELEATILAICLGRKTGTAR